MSGPEADELIQHIGIALSSLMTSAAALIIALRKVKKVNGKLDKHIQDHEEE